MCAGVEIYRGTIAVVTIGTVMMMMTMSASMKTKSGVKFATTLYP